MAKPSVYSTCVLIPSIFINCVCVCVSGFFTASGVWGSGALSEADLFPPHASGFAGWHWPCGWPPYAHLSDHVPDAAERSPSILVDCGPHVRSNRFSLINLHFITTKTPLPSAAGSNPTVLVN